MRRLFVRFAVASLLASLPVLAPSLGEAQTAALVEHSARVAGAVNPGETVRLSGHVPVYADVSRIPSTAMAPNAKFAHLALMLTRSPAVEAAFQQLLADQLNPASPRFHQWLTPAQVGALYGPAQTDVDAVTRWLQGQGLTVNSVSPSRLSIDFGGPVAAVEKAFGTSFRIFSLANGEQRYSLMQEPSVPAALQPVVGSIAGLSEVIHRSNAVHRKLAARGGGATGGASAPDYTVINSSGEFNYLFSGDFNTAYDITSTLSAGTNGTGQNIAIIGESRVYAADISQLETMEGLATKQANVIIPTTGTDPGTTGDDAQGEATLDVDRTIGTAPGATIDLVVSGDVGAGNTYATDGLFIAINYEISTVNDPIMSISFGGCEALDGQANTVYEASLFTTAASQGISTFVSSGDNGAAGCNFDYATIPANQVASINDLCSSTSVTCVGGTEFAADASSPTTYWSSTNSSTFSSLQTYIPEGAWNDPYYSTKYGYDQSGGTGGGTSAYIARPTWQTGTGVPAGSYRLVPDVAFTASANHDGFVVCLNYAGEACAYTGTSITNAGVFGGTSAAAPSMAGIQALVNQKLGGRQGNVNPTIYSQGNLGTAFHDVTVASSGVSGCVVTTPSLCNNSTPAYTTLTGGLSGYLVNAGYDEATGWGSLDVTKYIAAISSTSPTFAISPASPTLNFTSGATSGNTTTLTLTSLNSFVGTVALRCVLSTSSAAFQPTCVVSPAAVPLTSSGTGTATLTIGSTVAKTAARQDQSIAASRGWPIRGGGALALLLFCTPLRRRRKALGAFFLMAILTLGLGMISGCSGGAGTTIPVTQSSAGTYTVTITGSGTTTGGTTAVSTTATVTVTIN